MLELSTSIQRPSVVSAAKVPSAANLPCHGPSPAIHARLSDRDLDDRWQTNGQMGRSTPKNVSKLKTHGENASQTESQFSFMNGVFYLIVPRFSSTSAKQLKSATFAAA